LFAALDELGNAKSFYVPLRLEAEFLLNLDFNPKPLTIEAVLVSELESLHGFEALEEILVCTPAGVMHPHWVVSSDRAVEK
jgi:hypothetical protein